MVVGAPILIAWATVAVFWAEDRFRFHVLPLLAVCSGVWIDGLVRGIQQRRSPGAGERGRWAPFAVLAVLIVGASLLLESRFPPPPIRWDHVVWGTIKMGRLQDAQVLATRVNREQPDNEPIIEALGYLAATGRDYASAVRFYERAVALRPRSSVAHFNLAKAWLAAGDRPKAAAEATVAASLDPTPEAAALLRESAEAR
jgi:tetratricopeptide (TPR) repeat protein